MPALCRSWRLDNLQRQSLLSRSTSPGVTSRQSHRERGSTLEVSSLALGWGVRRSPEALLLDREAAALAGVGVAVALGLALEGPASCPGGAASAGFPSSPALLGAFAPGCGIRKANELPKSEPELRSKSRLEDWKFENLWGSNRVEE